MVACLFTYLLTSLIELQLYTVKFSTENAYGHGRPQGGGKEGHLPPPLEFEKMTSYAAVLQNYLKFSLAPSALALDTLYFSLKCLEKRLKFSFAPSARRNRSIFCTARRRRVDFLKCR